MSVNTTTFHNIKSSYASLGELLAATDPKNGNYVIQLYGNTFIHQKPISENNTDNGSEGTITAYQTDNQGNLHFIADIISNQMVSQLSVSADGRYFGFLTNNNDLTTGYVYFLDTITTSMEVVYSWSYKHCPATTLFFSQNGQFVVFSPYAGKLHVQALYTDKPDVIFEVPATLSETPNINYLIAAEGPDYLVWWLPSGHLRVIDLVAGQQPAEWTLAADDSKWLPTKDSSCMFYNNYIIHIHNHSEQPDTATKAKITILAVSSISQTVRTVSKFSFPEIGGYTWCEVNSDGQSITLHNRHKNGETRMSALLPEIITNFTD